MRILHTADINLDAPLKSLAMRDPDLRQIVSAATRGAFERIVTIAIEEQVAALIIAGDLFDGQVRSAQTAAFLSSQMDRLKAAGIRVFSILGNHDAESPVTGSVDFPDNVHVFSARGGKEQLSDDVWIHGVSFRNKHAPDSLLDRFDAPVAGAVNIALLHTSLAGAPGHDPYAPCSVGDLAAMGFDYWALGHIHKWEVHSSAPWIVMPGTPQGRDIGESGAKSATMLEIEGAGITAWEVPTAGVSFDHVTVAIGDGVETDEDIRGAVRQSMRDTAGRLVADAGVIRVRITGAPERHWQILRDRDVWEETARDIARETGPLWLDKLILDITAPSDSRETGNALSELAGLMEGIRREQGFVEATSQSFEAIMGAVPPAARSMIADGPEAARAFEARCAEAGAELVRARLAGAST